MNIFSIIGLITLVGAFGMTLIKKEEYFYPLQVIASSSFFIHSILISDIAFTLAQCFILGVSIKEVIAQVRK